MIQKTTNWLEMAALIPALLLALVCEVNVSAQSIISPPSGCVGWWTGDGNANDIQVTNNGILQNGATFTNGGKWNQAFLLDGIDDYVICPTSGSLGMTSGISAELWMKPDFTNGGRTFISKIDSSGWAFGISEGQLRVALVGGGGYFLLTTNANITPGAWTHVAFTFDMASQQLKFFINGIEQGAPPPPQTISTLSANGIPIRIGAYYAYGGQVELFAGALDEVRIYDRALTPSEIQNLAAGIIITNQPQHALTLLAGTGTFTVGVSGQPPLFYQWRFNGTNLLADQTNATLVISNVQPADVGIYSVIISNSISTIVSSNVFLTIISPGLDDDGDGLNNASEIQFGTNPLSPDTDRDNLTDFDEIYVYHTNPLLADTDGDGIPDDWEIQHGLNPLVNDAAQIGAAGVSNLQIYQYNLTHTNQLDPHNPFIAPGTSIYEIINNGQHTNSVYYDHNDRLVGEEFSRGVSIAYKYDGNGNPIRQTYLSRASETNGLPVLWQFLNGLNNNIPDNGPSGDSDGDGWSNYQEWEAGTDPNNSQSVPNLLKNPGTNMAMFSLPFTPANWVMTAGQLNAIAGDEIVVGADGNPGTNNNVLFVLTQAASGWTTQQVNVGSYGITSVSIGQPANRPTPAVYVGLRKANGGGQVMEFINVGGIWQSNLIAISTNASTFVLGARSQDLLASLSPTNGHPGALYSLSFSNPVWNLNILSTNVSHRISGNIGIVNGGVARQAGFRLLDGGGIEVAGLGREFLGNRSLIPSNSVYYARTDKWYFQTASDFWQTTESACEALGGNLVTINSADENQWLHTTYPFTFHIGYYASVSWTGYNTVYGSWQWISGTPTTYHQWGSDPNGIYSTYYFSGAAAYMGNDGSWNVEGLSYYYFTPPPSLPGIGDLAGGGGLSIIPEPSTTNRITSNTSVFSCFTRANQTNGFSVLYAYVDDKNVSGTVDTGDEFVFAEILVTTNGWTTNTLDRKTFNSTSASSSFGIATADLTGSQSRLPFSAEPDGMVYYWTVATNGAHLQRQLFSADYAGKSWSALTSVTMPAIGQAVAGLMVDPTNQNTCNFILWPPQPVLPAPQSSIVETAPSAIVVPSSNPLGSNAVVTVRLWDNEGNASTPFLQYQIPGTTNWQNSTITTLDGAAYSLATRVTALQGGYSHTLRWNALDDVGANVVTNVLLRASAQDFMLTGAWSQPTAFQLNTTVATVSNPANYPITFTGITRVAGGIQFNWQGNTNSWLYLQRSPALSGTNAVWVNIWTGAPPTQMFGSYTDYFGTNPMGFYRIITINQ